MSLVEQDPAECGHIFLTVNVGHLDTVTCLDCGEEIEDAELSNQYWRHGLRPNDDAE